MTAASAEEALELLRGFHPALILADIQLNGMDGLEFTRRVKSDPATSDIAVVALTAFAMKGDEQKAIDAGCDGYITKPIDTRALGARIREVLERRGGAPTPQPAANKPSEKVKIDPAEMLALRRRFLGEGQDSARNLLLELDGTFDAAKAQRVVHQWIGTGGLLGYTAISRLARETEAVLMEKPLDNAQLRDALANLAMAFNSPREARDEAVPESIVHTLSGKRIAAVGFPPNEQERLTVSLERAQAFPVFLDPATLPSSPGAEVCALVAVRVGPDTLGTQWLDPASVGERWPMVFSGARDDLLALDGPVQALAREFLMDSWLPEEALVRFSLALSPRPPIPAQVPGAAPGSGLPAQGKPSPISGRPRVLVADDDPVVLALVRTAVENFGMECLTAQDGRAAAESIRRSHPHAAVLDVNMPAMDGYEVLSAIRSEELPVRVILLTARQQESDVIRGFTLGADDYIVKPFSPMELVARIKRLLLR